MKAKLKLFGRRLLSIHPAALGIGVLVLALLIYFSFSSISSWYFERGVGKHIEKREEIRDRATELEGKAEGHAAEGNVFRQQAEEAEADLRTKRETVQEKKIYADKQTEKATNAGTRSIADGDLPSDAQLCTRANSLGVRCDFNK